MACNVFGNPVTDITLEGMGCQAGKITRLDRAKVAFSKRNAEGKDVNAKTFVENLKKQYGDGVSTLCLVYNATGDPVEFQTNHDWHGEVWSSPYPSVIQNGQWGAFLHVHPTAQALGSVGAAVYRGKNNNGDLCDWMFSWDNPWGKAFYNNKAYAEVREPGYYDDGSKWEECYNKLCDGKDSKRYIWNKCISWAQIPAGTSPTFEADLYLEGADTHEGLCDGK